MGLKAGKSLNLRQFTVGQMFFNIHELELHKIDFAETFAPGMIELTAEMEQKTPLQASGHAELLEEHHGGGRRVQDIRVIGGFSTQVEANCSRCLEPVAHDLAVQFDLLYRPLGVNSLSDEVAISEAETEISFYSGEGLALEDVLKEQVLLALPAKPLCQETCKGLCPHCGQNLNAGRCDCSVKPSDPRWNALAGIKDKLKQ